MATIQVKLKVLGKPEKLLNNIFFVSKLVGWILMMVHAILPEGNSNLVSNFKCVPFIRVIDKDILKFGQNPVLKDF